MSYRGDSHDFRRYDDRRPDRFSRGGRPGGSRGPQVNAGSCFPPVESELFRVVDAMDLTQIDYSFYDLPIKLHCNGKQDIKPLESIEELWSFVPECMVANIKRMKYYQPTPIQKYALPIVLSGHDLLATSQTGSGKSAAFLLPILKRIIENNYKQITNSPTTIQDMQWARGRYGGRSAPFAIVLSPTRELALQNFTAAWQFSFKSGTLIRVVYGGEGMGEQSYALRCGGDVIIATPGRLKAFIENGLVDLSNVVQFVLDEADTMIDMGFIDDIKMIRSSITEAKRIASCQGGPLSSYPLQTLLFSATFPKEIQNIAYDFLRDPYHLEIGQAGVTGTNINYLLLNPTLISKFTYLKAILQLYGKMLIFCNYKVQVQYLTEQLRRDVESGKIDQIPDDIRNEVNQLFQTKQDDETRSTTTVNPELKSARDIECLHGDNTYRQRIIALENFKLGKLKVLVCTDVAYRGLDLPKVDYVINYDFPKTIEDYSHRVGRTGRAGRRGNSISFIGAADSLHTLRYLRAKLLESKQTIPYWFEDLTLSKGRSGQRGRSGYGGGYGGSYGGGYRGGYGGGYGGRYQGGYDRRPEYQGRDSFRPSQGDGEPYRGNSRNDDW